MKVVVAAGGTGGHLYPALALVEYIKKQDPNSKFLFIGMIVAAVIGVFVSNPTITTPAFVGFKSASGSCSPTWI